MNHYLYSQNCYYEIQSLLYDWWSYICKTRKRFGKIRIKGDLKKMK